MAMNISVAGEDEDAVADAGLDSMEGFAASGRDDDDPWNVSCVLVAPDDKFGHDIDEVGVMGCL